MTSCRTCLYCRIDYRHFVIQGMGIDPCGLNPKTGVYGCLTRTGNAYKNYKEASFIESEIIEQQNIKTMEGLG